MTKLRTPGSWEDALDIIKGALGAERMGEVVQRSAQHIRSHWCNPDEPESLPNIEQARLLDEAYHRETGEPGPLLAVYTRQQEATARPHVIVEPGTRMGQIGELSGEAIGKYAAATGGDNKPVDGHEAHRALQHLIDAAASAQRDLPIRQVGPDRGKVA